MIKHHLLNVKQLSEYLGISVNTIYAMVSQCRIPFVKVERLTKFDIEKVDEWIKNNSFGEENFRHITKE